MPKIVDHEQRRRELGAAVWRVIRRDGVDGASVRAVAAESGWSAGALRHYFTTQTELLRFAVELTLERAPARIRAHLDADIADPLDRARRILEELLPLDDERLVEVLVWLAFTDRRRVDPELSAVREQSWHGTRYMCRLAVADIRGLPRPATLTAPLTAPFAGDEAAGDETAGATDEAAGNEAAGNGAVDAERRAEHLHAFVDGLTLHAVTYPEHMPPERLRAALLSYLETLTTG